MGVPKFFRYISERYPCLSEVVREYQLPEFDNLYLDMNGIIHICSHPNDADPHFRITEEKIFRDIFHYIETLFRMIQPQKLFFMAVDGVAPRAKMNQQRGRRFRSAKEAEVAEQRARDRGEVLPTVDRFDSNCITPGTEFMTRLHAQLKYFVTLKVSSDKLWQKCKVILSGHETPGEGEHKIMDYIRYMKSQPDYDPNTRHCLYGLDADLIMLGLCTHEPHFSLLREEVKYGKKNNQKRIPTPEETTFFLLHLSLMREYLDLEFQQLKTTLPFPYDVECIIDDWVLMGFLVGNDFIPHLPDLHINKGALPILYRTYLEVLPTLGGYINEAGHLRLDRFQKYMEKLAAFDFEQFKETSADLKWLEAKSGRKYGRHSDKSNEQEDEQPPPPKNKDLAALIASTEEMLEGSEDDDEDADSDSDEEGTSFAEFCAHKNNYYMEKLEYDKVTPEVLRNQAEGYVRAIQWNLHYYYNGCCSWSWFYPHHYAPYISDIRNFSGLQLEYEQGQPFLPFQQLLAVLPAASKKLLPEAYHDLMEDDKSPIIQFYPTEFKTDLNGKRQDWEAVVLIPFIEQESLLQAMKTKEGELTEEERSRNKHGPMQVYTYTPERLGPYLAPAYFPALVNNHAKEENVYREQLFVERSRLIKGLCPGVKLDVYYLGFPTLKHIPFMAALRKAKVKVFESPSQGDNMILTITAQGSPNVTEVATQLLGKSIYVNWPHMFEARVVAVANEEIRFSLRPDDSSCQSERTTAKQLQQWSLGKQSIEDRYMDRMGINVGRTEILVYACTLEDRKFVMSDDGKIHQEKQWSKLPVAYALQTTRTNIAVQEPEPPVNLNLEKLFAADTVVFMLDPHHYGAKATVLEVCKNHRVKVTTVSEPNINMDSIKQNLSLVSPPYMSGNEIGKKLGVSSHLVSRVTGTIFILAAEPKETENKPYKLNIGLNLKFNRRNEEVCGYTRRDKQSGYWFYSSKAEQEIREYKKKFPEVFEYLANQTGFEDVNGKELYPEDTEEKLAELGAWLKQLGSCGAERQTCGAEVLDEAVVASIEQYIDSVDNIGGDKPIMFNAKPSYLYLPKPKLGQAPDPRASHRLFDRVVNVRECHTVPLGARGTIIGIHDSDKGPQAMYDVVFDKPFTGGLKLRCSPHRGYRLPAQAFINRSYGMASEAGRSSGKPTAVVEPTGAEDEAGGWNNNSHSSAFASWRNKQNYDIGGSPHQNGPARQKVRGGGEVDHRSPKHQYNAQRGLAEEQEHRGGGPRYQHNQPEYSLRPEQPQHPRGRQYTPNPHPPPHQPAPNQLSNEYLAMFKQLQKVGSNNVSKPITNSKDPSDALKKILRIADESKNSMSSAAPPPPQHQHQQPTKTAPPQHNTKPHSFIKQLLSLHQSHGWRLPKYLYSDAQDGTIICTVICGNNREFQGPPSYTNEQAAENAAKIALQCNALEEQPRGHGGMMMGPPGPAAGVAPFPHGPNRHPPAAFPPNSRVAMGWAREPAMPSTLPQPPTNWYKNQPFMPDWSSGADANGKPYFQFPNSPVIRFPSMPGHLPPVGMHFQQMGARPSFIPSSVMQAQSRHRQPPPPQSQPPPHYPQQTRPPPPSKSRHNKSEPAGARGVSGASGRNSARPQRSRLAANFSVPLKFDGASNSSQDTQ